MGAKDIIFKFFCVLVRNQLGKCSLLIWVISFFRTVTGGRKASVSDVAVHGRFGESFVRWFNLKYRSFWSSWKIDLITRYFFQFFNQLVDIILKSAACLTSLHVPKSGVYPTVELHWHLPTQTQPPTGHQPLLIGGKSPTRCLWFCYLLHSYL